MFVVVTLVAIFISYHVRWIQQRHELRDDRQRVWKTGNMFGGEVRAPGLLSLFGEPGCSQIEVPVEADRITELTNVDMQAGANARRLFPEARIIARHNLPRHVLCHAWIAPFPEAPDARDNATEQYIWDVNDEEIKKVISEALNKPPVATDGTPPAPLAPRPGH